MIDTQVLIIGGGAAGLTAAIELSQKHKVSVISKETIVDSSTWYAQGGIAAVMGEKDTVEEHIADTLEVGDEICDKDAVAHCVKNSKSAIDWLIEMGVNFTMTQDGEKLHLTQEGGHSKRRVAHSKDTTGKEVSNSLIARARKLKNITIYENHLAVDLITSNRSCLGAYVFDKKKEQVITFKSNATILASGGASKVYLYTSNPDGTSGDGMALAWRAGCELSNMEFNQFHPTCLYHPEAKSFLISEALRGEGAYLLNHENERFMKKYHKKNELAPRDVVARSIDEEMKKTGKDFMFLDISHKPKKMILKSFPAIHEKCLSFGFDITKEKIPIVPLYLAKIRPIIKRDGLMIMVDDDRLEIKQNEKIEQKKVRFRTLGCYPLTAAIESSATNVEEIIIELLETKYSERQGRLIDSDQIGSMEIKKQEGYF